ncbi:sugar ABC transporter substrate-binding protein [uncultured Jatrophihabitans sp.]|uniref:sugar ABC transporter substrate-binding protein n=1 Tax=uncultured Jatrophihabitans sp. TaxID=1610747 RepID=UPI0035CC4520
MALAKRAVAELVAPPTANLIRTPLNAAPTKGKTIVYLQCTDGEQCALIGQGVKAAAGTVGWNVKTVDFQESNPSTLAAGLRLALQYHPVASIVVGVPYALWSSVVPAYAQAGVDILPLAVGAAPVTRTVLPQVNGTAYQEQQGDDLANWVIADSDGNAHVLVLMVPAYAVLSSFLSAFRSTVNSRCPHCTISVVNATIPQIDGNQTNGLIVSALQKDPKLGYFVSSDSVFVNGLPQALSGAGMGSRVKIGGAAFGTEQIADIKNGTESAWTGQPSVYSGWLAVDTILRSVEGMKVTGNEPLPEQLITRANVESLKSTSYYIPPFDYQGQFARTWKVA